MTPVVIDASVGVEIVASTARGRRLAALLPVDAVGWVPEHFYAEVAGVLRHQLVVARAITDAQANVALERLRRWHLRRSSVAALIAVAWGFRHNMTTADAIYVALAVELGAMSSPTITSFSQHLTSHRLSTSCDSPDLSDPCRSNRPCWLSFSSYPYSLRTANAANQG